MKNLFLATSLCTLLLFYGCSGKQNESKKENSQDTTISQSPSSTSNKDSLTVDSGGETMPKKPEQP